MGPTQQSPQQRTRGGQTADGSRQKILRIGIVLGEKIVEERLIRKRDNVTIGQSGRNLFAVPSPELPRTWALFLMHGGRYFLQVTDLMDARVSDGNNVSTLAQLKAAGGARKISGGWQIAISEAARGKITVGEMVLLFQFVTPPPLQPAPQLPQSVRGRLLDRIDPWMATILAISLVFHGFVGAYLYTMDVPKPPEPDEVPDRFAKGLLERPVIVKEEKPASSGITETPTEAKVESKKETKKKEEPSEPAPAPDQAAVAQKVENTALFKVLGAKTQGGSGRFVDVTGGKNTTGDLDKGLANVGNSGASLGLPAGGLGGGTRGGGTGEIGTGTRTGVNGPSGPGSLGSKREEDIKVDIRTGSIEDIEAGGLDPNKVAATIKSRYAAGVRQCYQRALKSNPKLQGKLNVGFTVGPAGNVTKVNVDGLGPEVDSCVETQARHWRFDKPEDGSAEFEFPFILRPGS